MMAAAIVVKHPGARSTSWLKDRLTCCPSCGTRGIYRQVGVRETEPAHCVRCHSSFKVEKLSPDLHVMGHLPG
jgi:hypothetical protein